MYANAAGAKIFYDVVAGEQPVLLLHGFGSDSTRTWVGAGWPRALDGRGAVLVDLRGHGQSDRPDTGYSPREMAADVAAVLDAAGMSTMDAVGYSMGGLVAWELARQGRVRRLVLGGIDGRPVSEEDLPPGLPACADAVVGHGIDGDPPVPVLVVAGEADALAAEAGAFAARIGAPFVPVPRRNHVTAVSSRVFKQAAIAFFGVPFG